MLSGVCTFKGQRQKAEGTLDLHSVFWGVLSSTMKGTRMVGVLRRGQGTDEFATYFIAVLAYFMGCILNPSTSVAFEIFLQDQNMPMDEDLSSS